MFTKTYSPKFISEKTAQLISNLPEMIQPLISEEQVSKLLIPHFSEMANHAFQNLKKQLRDLYTEETLPTQNDVRKIIVTLEEEYAIEREMSWLGIEDDFTLDCFAKNQWSWLCKNFRFTLNGKTLGELIENQEEVF